MKLKPEITVRDSTAGSAATRLSTRFSTSIARSCEVPGGSVTTPIIVPVSSLGTIPVGVIFMKTISRTTEAVTIPADNHFFWMKKSTCFLYFFTMLS